MHVLAGLDRPQNNHRIVVGTGLGLSVAGIGVTEWYIATFASSKFSVPSSRLVYWLLVHNAIKEPHSERMINRCFFPATWHNLPEC